MVITEALADKRSGTTPAATSFYCDTLGTCLTVPPYLGRRSPLILQFLPRRVLLRASYFQPCDFQQNLDSGFPGEEFQSLRALQQAFSVSFLAHPTPSQS
jgi:hypothetical protein